MRRALLIVALLFGAWGCAAVARFHTEPEGATVYVNGLEIGETPVAYHNEPGLPERYHVQIVKPGYEPLDFYLDSRISWLWGYLGAVTLVPYLWAWSLSGDYVFELTPAEIPQPGPEEPPAEAPTELPREAREHSL